jgi:hypothetical protein
MLILTQNWSLFQWKDGTGIEGKALTAHEEMYRTLISVLLLDQVIYQDIVNEC